MLPDTYTGVRSFPGLAPGGPLLGPSAGVPALAELLSTRVCPACGLSMCGVLPVCACANATRVSCPQCLLVGRHQPGPPAVPFLGRVHVGGSEALRGVRAGPAAGCALRPRPASWPSSLALSSFQIQRQGGGEEVGSALSRCCHSQHYGIGPTKSGILFLCLLWVLRTRL